MAREITGFDCTCRVGSSKRARPALCCVGSARFVPTCWNGQTRNKPRIRHLNTPKYLGPTDESIQPLLTSFCLRKILAGMANGILPDRTLYIQNVPTGDWYIIPTSLAVAYSIGKYTNKKSMSHYITYTPIPNQYSCFWWPAIESRKTVANQKEEEEWPVGTCPIRKFTITLLNVPTGHW